MEVDNTSGSAWLTLEPGIMSNIAKRLSRGDAGALRLTCKTWKQAVSLGVQSMAVVCSSAKFFLHPWHVHKAMAE